MNITLRVVLVLSVVLIIPASAALYLLESSGFETLQSFLSIHLALSLAFLVPISRLSGYLIIGREISDLAAFCRKIKNGQYDCTFTLPNEKEDEPEIIKLKRLLNWMVHSLSVRENTQRYQLGKNEELKKHYRNLSMQDELTRLYNRRHFNAQLPVRTRNALRDRESLCLMLIDVDNFKQINDTCGHQAGDDLLKDLADILQNSIRSADDIPFRYGGDEFGIIFPGISFADGKIIAERIKNKYADAVPGITSLSIGVAFLNHSCDNADNAVAELIKAADDCVYRAKTSGRNKVSIEDSHKRELLHREKTRETMAAFVYAEQPRTRQRPFRTTGTESVSGD
jgi:diguanylate cyclase (GGDEF)-like protein